MNKNYFILRKIIIKISLNNNSNKEVTKGPLRKPNGKG